jgi:hypothetical protein
LLSRPQVLSEFRPEAPRRSIEMPWSRRSSRARPCRRLRPVPRSEVPVLAVDQPLAARLGQVE